MPFPRNILIIFLLFPLSGCFERPLPPDNTLVTILSSPITSLDPLFATDATTQHVNQLVHIALLRMGPDLMPQPALAKSYKVINDKVMEFRLRSGCKFQNGQEITAHDVEKSFELYSSKEYKSAFQAAFSKIERFEIVDTHTIRLHTKEPVPALLYDLPVLKIFPKGDYSAEKYQVAPTGGGPYRVVRNSPDGILLERFDNGCEPLPQMPFIQAKVVRDDLSRFLKLRNGEIDFVLNDLDLRKVKMIMEGKVPGVKALAENGTMYSYMGLNQANPHLKKLAVRQAIAYAIDAEKMIQYKLVNFAVPTASIVPPNSWYHHPSLKAPTRNLAEAQRLLDEAGYYNGHNQKPVLKLSLKTTTWKPVVENARAIVEQLREAGIEVTHKAYEWGTFYGDVKTRNTEMFLLRWTGVASPNIMNEIFHSARMQEMNRINYSNPEMDKYLDQGASTLDPEKRKHAYLRAQEIAAEDLPYISLWTHKNVAIFRDSIHNVELIPTGDWDVFTKIVKAPRSKL